MAKETARSPTATLLGGKKVKGKSRKKGAADTDQNYLAIVVKEIENMKDEEVLSYARELADGVERDYFKLGGLLERIHAAELYHQQGYQEFGDYVLDTFGFRRSKALHLIQIYNVLVELEIPWDRARDVPWCKLRLLAKSGVMTKKNAEKWLEAAKKVSYTKLADYIKQRLDKLKADGGEGGDAPSTSEMYRLTFSLHEDQKDTVELALEKAQEDGDTSSKNVALYYICTSFMQDGKVVRVKAKPLLDQIRKMRPMEVLDMFTEAHPKFHVTVTEKGGK